MMSVGLSSCSGDNPACIEPEQPRQASVTLMVTENSLGDNGYNDCAADGILAFAYETGTPLRMLRPTDMTEAEAMYRRWLEEHAEADSAVLIVGSTAYEPMVRQWPPALKGRGSRVLLVESDNEIAGVTTVMIDRYGVGYLAGAMSRDFDALILAAAPGYSTLERAIGGFNDARSLHAGEHNGQACTTELHYLADGEEGFSMPDSAYRYIAHRAEGRFNYDEMIFPLLGGSQSGIKDRLNDDLFNAALMIGMDTDQAGQCTRLPFSVEIRIGDVLRQLLHGWLRGEEWQGTCRPGMKEGAAGIAVNGRFGPDLVLSDDRYSTPGEFERRYKQYLEEALQNESERHEHDNE